MGLLHLLFVVVVRDFIRNCVAGNGTGHVGRRRDRNYRRSNSLANLQHIQILGADLPRGRGLEESVVSIQQMVSGKG